MSYRIGVDVGGTFTDVVVADSDGRLTLGKAPTTPARRFDGLYAALSSAATRIDLDTPQLLSQCHLFVYSTTTATNAILEGKTARTALLITEGFADVLVRREGGKPNPFDYTEPPLEPYIPRSLTFEIAERVDAEGAVVLPLREEDCQRALEAAVAQGAEAVAVCFLWSIANPVHEQAVGSLIAHHYPDLAVTLSHQLNPIMREYRRASATAIDASLKPVMQAHLSEIENELARAGLAGELYAATSVGGVAHVRALVDRPIYSVKSGPSLAPVAASAYAAAESGEQDLIVCDTGGTSFDVSLVRDSSVVFTREAWLGERLTGHLTGMSAVDVSSIGAGGGSIAWVDVGGLLRVGPESAGADPGPACYARGGSRPTVTDAAVVLGYLNPGYFLGGEMELDVAAAHRVVGEIAATLDISVGDAARGILTVANEHMVDALKRMTINQGIDPRDSLLVAGGGAAGLNVVPIAKELGCRRVLVPRTAGALSACGAQYCDIVCEFSASGPTRTDAFDFELVASARVQIDEAISAFARDLPEGVSNGTRRDYYVDARYPHQVWDIEIPVPTDAAAKDIDVAALVAEFHRTHERIFAVAEPDQHVECVNWKGRLTVGLDRPPIVPAQGLREGGAATTTREALFGPGAARETNIYQDGALAPRTVIDGPAIIEERTTTIVVYPGSSAVVTPRGNYLIQVHDDDS